MRWSGNFGQCVKADSVKADRSHHGEVHLKFADPLSKLPGPPQTESLPAAGTEVPGLRSRTEIRESGELSIK